MTSPTSRLVRAETILRAMGALAITAALGGAGVAEADALSSPSMTAPLSANANPFSFDTGTPLGKIYVSGQLTGLGLVQSNATPAPGNATGLFDLSNGQIEVQTTSGPVQLFVEAGAYSFPALGTPYLRVGKNTSDEFGALPVAYAKIVATPEINVQVGVLPTLIGAEYGFTFQNMNIERGLLWNQEPVVSKGVQANYAKGPFTVSLSVNDGYDSDHYNWVSGLITWAPNAASSFTLDGGTNFGTTYTTKFRAPDTLSNSSIFDASYTWTKGPWLINPYFQYTHVDREPYVGQTAANTYSGAVLAKYSFTPTLSLAGRAEYISSHTQACPTGIAYPGGEGGDSVVVGQGYCVPTSLLYGPGSNAFSITATPTWQKGLVFVRGEVSYVRAGDVTPGYGFGGALTAHDQVRGLVETGILF